MNIDRTVFAIAGTMILVSLAMSQTHSPYWLGLTAFVGLNMFQAAFTGFCPVAIAPKLIRVQLGDAFSWTSGRRQGEVTR
jgi:hypothetical protein